MAGEEGIRINGETREAFRIQVSYAGMEATSWYDREGRVLKEVSPMGFSMIREDAGQARRGLMEGDEAVDITASTMVSVDKHLPDPTGLRYLRVLLEGIDPAGFEIEGGYAWARAGSAPAAAASRSITKVTGIETPQSEDAFSGPLEKRMGFRSTGALALPGVGRYRIP